MWHDFTRISAQRHKHQSGANAANWEGTVPQLEFPHHQSQTRTKLIAAAVTGDPIVTEQKTTLDV